MVDVPLYRLHPRRQIGEAPFSSTTVRRPVGCEKRCPRYLVLLEHAGGERHLFQAFREVAIADHLVNCWETESHQRDIPFPDL